MKSNFNLIKIRVSFQIFLFKNSSMGVIKKNHLFLEKRGLNLVIRVKIDTKRLDFAK